jgi:hypothetical protein
MSNARRPPSREDEPERADATRHDDASEIETGPDGPKPVDPMAPGRSLFDDDAEAVEPNEPA